MDEGIRMIGMSFSRVRSWSAGKWEAVISAADIHSEKQVHAFLLLSFYGEKSIIQTE